MTNQNTINVAYIFESKAFSQCTFFTGTSDILNSTHDEHKLLKLLVDIDTNWHELGQALKITYNDLEGLEQSLKCNKVKLGDVINKWMTSQPSPVTWNTIITAIEDDIGNKKKVNEIRCHLGLQLC